MATREEIAQSFLAAENVSLIELAKALINQGGFIDDGWLQGQCDYAGYSILTTAHQILMTTLAEVLRGLITGTISTMAGNSDLQYLQSSQYVAVPHVVNAEDIVLPVIYAVYLVDLQTNEPLTVRDTQEMIDNVKQKLGGMKGDSKIAAKSLTKLLADRINGCNPNSLLLRGLVDIGFAGKGPARLAQHQSGANSNEVMQVFRDAARDVNACYGLQSFIICKMRKYEHCSLAEVLFSRLSQSYISRGGGFNGAVAGLSIKGAQLLSVMAWDRIGGVQRDRVYQSSYAIEMAKIKTAAGASRRQL